MFNVALLIIAWKQVILMFNTIMSYIIWDFIQPFKKYEVTEFQRKQMKLETISLEKQTRHG